MSEFNDSDNPAPNYPKRTRQHRRLIGPNGNEVEIDADEEKRIHTEGMLDGWQWVPMPVTREPAPARVKVGKTTGQDPTTGRKVLIRGGVLAVIDGTITKVQNGTTLPKGARWATADDAAGWVDPEVAALRERR